MQDVSVDDVANFAAEMGTLAYRVGVDERHSSPLVTMSVYAHAIEDATAHEAQDTPWTPSTRRWTTAPVAALGQRTPAARRGRRRTPSRRISRSCEANGGPSADDRGRGASLRRMRSQVRILQGASPEGPA
jgi:hypothetical protein